jgi:hypothetical protein
VVWKQGPDSFNQSSSFRLGQYAEQADYAQAERGRGPAATSPNYQEQIRSPLQGQHNRLGFARVKLGAQLPHAGLVLRGGNNQPRAAAQVDQRRRTIGARQLPTHRWWDKHLVVEGHQQIQPADHCQVQDG